MAEKTLAGTAVEVDDEGYLTDSTKWTEDMAGELAAGLDITLTDEHWKVIRFMRGDYAENGDVPTLRKISKKSGVDMKGIYTLFPDGPVKKAAMISGLPKPKSCV